MGKRVLRLRAGPDVQYCIQKSDGCWYPADRLSYGGCVQRTVSIDDAYFPAEAAVVRERLKMPGVRLGAILNTVLAITGFPRCGVSSQTKTAFSHSLGR